MKNKTTKKNNGKPAGKNSEEMSPKHTDMTLKQKGKMIKHENEMIKKGKKK